MSIRVDRDVDGVWYLEYPFGCSSKWAMLGSDDEAMNIAALIVRAVHGERKPRTWDTVHTVPVGVTVSDRDGDLWCWESPDSLLISEAVDDDGSRIWDTCIAGRLMSHGVYAPFTEVVE